VHRDRSGEFIGLRHLVFRIIAGIPQPGYIEVIVPRGDFLTAKETKSSRFSFVLPLCLPQRVFPERLLKGLEVGQ